MPQVTIELHEDLYAELEAVSAEQSELGFTPARWAQEAVEVMLATRRLPRVVVDQLRREDRLRRDKRFDFGASP